MILLSPNRTAPDVGRVEIGVSEDSSVEAQGVTVALSGIPSDMMTDVLEDHADNAVAQELRSYLIALNDDEKADLITMVQLGRGDGTLEDWSASGCSANCTGAGVGQRK